MEKMEKKVSGKMGEKRGKKKGMENWNANVSNSIKFYSGGGEKEGGPRCEFVRRMVITMEPRRLNGPAFKRVYTK